MCAKSVAGNKSSSQLYFNVQYEDNLEHKKKRVVLIVDEKKEVGIEHSLGSPTLNLKPGK